MRALRRTGSSQERAERRSRSCVLGLAVFLVAVVVASSPSIASGTNWGAGKSSQAVMCTDIGDPDFEFSECTTDNELWLVYILSQVPSGLRTALENSVDEDFDTISGITGVVTTLSSSADVWVFYLAMDPTLESAFGTCMLGSTLGLVNVRYHMWCKPQEIVYQNFAGKANDCWNNGPCRRHYACHELGHTFGLRHSSASTSCMSYANSPHPENLRAHDIDHVVHCYPHPTMPLPTYPAETRSTACKQA